MIADNLGLLHGRRAFPSAEPRRIRRVNVRVTRKRTVQSMLLDSLRIAGWTASFLTLELDEVRVMALSRAA